MASLADIQSRMAQWQEENRIPTGGSGNRLFMGAGDIMFGWFLGSGSAGDPFFELWMAHEYQGATPQSRTLKPCPVLSGWDQHARCQGCDTDIKTKPQMSMVFYVSDILRAQPPREQQAGKPAPQAVAYSGRTMFHHQIADFLLWSTSAWRDSPLNSILSLGAQCLSQDPQNGLRFIQMTLEATGDGLTRRYSIQPKLGTSPLPAEIVAKGHQTVEPVVQQLKKLLTVVPVTGAGGATPFAPTAASPFAPVAQPQFTPAPAPAQPQFPLAELAPTQAAPIAFAPVFSGNRPDITPDSRPSPAKLY